MQQKQIFDLFLVLDFEATCSDTNPQFRSEIIEFPIVVVDAKTGKIVAEFREYVRPVLNKTLSAFCVKLTGIEQETVDAAATFPVVFDKAQQFYKNIHQKYPDAKTVFVTCGDWDLQFMLPQQAQISNTKIPRYYHKWVNVKIPFREIRKDFLGDMTGGVGMPFMLQNLGLPLVGRHHSGLDDSRNIAKIVSTLVEKGVIIDITSQKRSLNK